MCPAKKAVKGESSTVPEKAPPKEKPPKRTPEELREIRIANL
jgi:hypothetical protein